jgi:hypothetical protein
LPGGVTLASYGLAAVAVFVALVRGIEAPAPDYLQFWTIGRAMPIASYHTLHEQPLALDSRGDPALARALDAGQRTLYLTATPLFYTVVALTSGASFSRDLRVFQLASTTIFVCGLVFLLRAWEYAPEQVALIVAACCLLAAPFDDDVAHGNVSRLYVGMTAALVWLTRRGPLVVRTADSQAWLALMVLFKPFVALALPALWLLRTRSGRHRLAIQEVAGWIAGAIVGLLLPRALIGAPLRLWEDFLRIQTRYIENGDYQARSLHDASVVETLSGLLRLSLVQFEALAATAGIVVATFVAAAATRERSRGSLDRGDVQDVDLAVLLSAAVFLMLSPLVWPHYYLLSIVFALFLLRRLPDGGLARRAQVATLLVALLLLAGNPLAMLADALWPTTPAHAASFLNGQLAVGHLLVCVVGLLDYARQGRRADRRLPTTIAMREPTWQSLR